MYLGVFSLKHFKVLVEAAGINDTQFCMQNSILFVNNYFIFPDFWVRNHLPIKLFTISKVNTCLIQSLTDTGNKT